MLEGMAGKLTVLLAGASSVGVLPHVVVEGEQDGLVTALLDNRLDGDGLLDKAGNSAAIALTLGRPAGLEDVALLARADLADDVELTLDELASLARGGSGVEEGVGVGANDVDGAAERSLGLGLLPDVDGLSGGEGARVFRELLLAGLDQGTDLLRTAVAVDNSLVTNNEELDHVPLSPLLESGDLLGNFALAGRAAGGADEDTDHQIDAVLLSGLTNELEGVAVSRVGA